MNKKLLVVAIAGALSAPSAFAATDTSGMQYTSASEGFYASIRLRYNSGGSDNAGADLQNSSSRIGVGGSNDLGGGLEGFYQWEMGVNTDEGADNGNTRVARVGLRGEFGQAQVGSFWTQSYNMVYGSTDKANAHSGNLAYTTLLPGRASQSIEYTSPNLNGFQGALMVQMKNSGDSTTKDDNDIDLYIFTGKYEVQGFTVAGSYSVNVDGIGKGNPAGNANLVAGPNSKKDHNEYALRLGYAQDNWYVDGWYSKDNASDSLNTNKDEERLSIAAGVEVVKVNIYAVYETLETPYHARYVKATGPSVVNGRYQAGTPAMGQFENVIGSAAPDMNATLENDYSAFGVQYNLGSRSRVWIEYAGQDLDTNTKAEDYVTIGLQHNF